MLSLQNIHNLTKNFLAKDLVQYMISNIIFSLSSFIVNLSLPHILVPSFFSKFIYVFQMVFFLTSVFQFGIVLGLYKFISEKKRETLNIYYLFILLINCIIILLGLIGHNYLSHLIKLDDLTGSQLFSFYLSVAVSGIYLFNKGFNIVNKSYKYMMRISLNAFIIRCCLIIFLFFFQIQSLSALLLLLFVLPYFQDIKDYIINTKRYFSFKDINKKLAKTFLIYIIKVWVIGVLFLISDKMFLISTKGLNQELTTAIAFSSGFLGIISLFNSTFTNYFLAKLSSNKIEDIYQYLKKLKKAFYFYIFLLISICSTFSSIIYFIYPSLGSITVIITFITLLRVGLISYLGMFSLLSKILDFLNLEIILNILRISITYLFCHYLHIDNYIIWYTIVIYTIVFPEITLAILINRKVQKQIPKINILKLK